MPTSVSYCIQGFTHDLILPPISTMDSVAPNLPTPSYPQLFVSYAPNPAPDPCRIPLPATSDADLHHGPTIASAVGCKPVAKTGGSRHKATASTSKGKGKRKSYDISDVDSMDTGDESEAPKAKRAHGGRRPGAGNYKDADIDELLRLVDEVLPIGGNGWKRIGVRYEQWATRNSRPARNAKALEEKFKGVCLPFLMYSWSDVTHCSS